MPAAVRTRMEEVLVGGEHESMREDARLVNFLGEVAEAQVSCRLFLLSYTMSGKVNKVSYSIN